MLSIKLKFGGIHQHRKHRPNRKPYTHTHTYLHIYIYMYVFTDIHRQTNSTHTEHSHSSRHQHGHVTENIYVFAHFLERWSSLICLFFPCQTSCLRIASIDEGWSVRVEHRKRLFCRCRGCNCPRAGVTEENLVMLREIWERGKWWCIEKRAVAHVQRVQGHRNRDLFLKK
jgi:hypothetical protein